MAHGSAKPAPEWLVLGVVAAGKTSLVRALSHNNGRRAGDVCLDTTSTNGVERETLHLGSTGRGLIILKEVGGSLQSTWKGYYAAAAGVLFVLDVSDPRSLSRSIDALVSVFQAPELATKPILLILTKTDMIGALSRTELHTATRLDHLIASAESAYTRALASKSPSAPSTKRIMVIEASASRGTGVQQVLQLLAMKA